jgi:DNA-binding MarR family transcriptional regulator/N-acetylglutamate synthase-like GNAT family acetyltransferase
MLDPSADLDTRVAAVRRFNRFYTRRIGLLQKGYLKSALSLAEIRVLYEIAHRVCPTASEIGRDLELDAGYLSRMLAGFARRGLIRKTPSAQDARQSHLALTARGSKTFVPLERRSRREIAALLEKLSGADQARTVAAMATIEALLAPAADARTPDLPPYLLRPHRPGDMGWVVSRHGSLYAEEYGWNIVIEAYVAEVVAEFLKTFDPARERCWIAEAGGEPVGSVFLMRESEQVAKLRLLIVEPKARGLGIGARLVAECIRFAGASGYRRITLWTHSILVAARGIYARAGFRLVDSVPHATFGPTLVGETWELEL